LEPLKLSSASAAGQKCKKKFFKRHFLPQWSEALKALEVSAPLLSLCFDVWKADLTLGWVLQDEQLSRPPLLPRAGPSRPSTPSNFSRPSTPSNLSRPPSSLARAPSALGIASHPAPPSSVHSSSFAARPSHIAHPRSSISSNAPGSRAPLTTSRRDSATAQPPPPGPRPADKAAGSKAKRRRDSSPPLRTGKRPKGSEAATSSRPAFMSLVQSNAASVSFFFRFSPHL
jgi:hypothetical protein